MTSSYTNLSNPKKKLIIGSIVFLFIGIALLFLPTYFGIDGMHGGFALMLLGILIALSTTVCAIVFHKQKQQIDAFLGGKGLIDHWVYPKDQRTKYVQYEHKRNKKQKLALLYTITGFAMLFAILFPLFDHEAGWVVSIIMGVVVVLVGIVAFVSIYLPHRHNINHQGEVYLFDTGVILNGRFHIWGGRGFGKPKLEDIKYKKNSETILFTYSIVAMYKKNYYFVSIPVPRDRIEDVPDLIKKYTG